MTIQVNEIFGPTVQGEGAASGRHCLFLRVADCNLRCTWCDTAYTWAFNEKLADLTESGIVHDKATNRIAMEPDEVLAKLLGLWDLKTRPTMLVISGGEPLMQCKNLEPIMRPLVEWGTMIHVETAGTLKPTPEFDNWVAQYNVSPKLAHSGNPMRMRRKMDVLEWFAKQPNAWFKFVMTSRNDFDEIDRLVRATNMNPHRVMVMPEGVSPTKNRILARELIDGALQRGYGLTFRTHILLWPSNVRGK